MEETVILPKKPSGGRETPPLMGGERRSGLDKKDLRRGIFLRQK